VAAALGIVYVSLPKSWFDVPDESAPAPTGPGARPPAPPGSDLPALAEAAAMNPLDFGARTRYGMALSAAGRADQALTEFQAARRLAPDNPIIYQNLGGWYLNRRDYAKAGQYFCRALEAAPGSGRGHYLRGMALVGQERHDEAIRQFRLAVGLDPQFADGYLQLAMAATKRAPESQVVAWIEEYRRLSGNSGLADYVLSGAYKTWHKYDGAIRFAESSVKQDAGNYAFWHNLGQVYAYARRYDDAERALAKAQELTPKPGTVLIERGMNAQSAGRVRDAVSRFQEALKASPETGNVHQYLARAYQRLGEAEAGAREEAAYRRWERTMHEIKTAHPIE
jgi:tetratricopeptide (TPR) repeat protein